MSFALAGLFVATIAAPASAGDGSTYFASQKEVEYFPPQKKAEYFPSRKQAEYFPPQKAAELHVKPVSNYTGCQGTLRELGWNDPESYYYCSWLHSHMRPNGGRAGKALVATGFVGVQQSDR
jgi:hypothetical protein